MITLAVKGEGTGKRTAPWCAGEPATGIHRMKQRRGPGWIRRDPTRFFLCVPEIQLIGELGLLRHPIHWGSVASHL